MVQDSFGDTPVVALDDSGPPYDDKYMPVCMQKRWREGWGFQLRPDCKECQQADGGGFAHLSDFLMKKHPKGKYVGSGQFSTYFMSGQLHQHIFRPEFYTATAGSETEAASTSKLLAGQMEQVGP